MSEADNSGPRPKSPRKLFTRREFLKGAATGIGALIVYGVAKVVGSHPELPQKALDSITSGKAKKDIDEIVESRLRLNNSKVTLKNSESGPKHNLEPWMTEVASSVRILEVEKGKKVFPMLLIDITDTTFVCPANKKDGEDAQGIRTVFYDLGQVLDKEKILTLPGPQYQKPQSSSIRAAYAQYKMYAQAEGQEGVHSQLGFSDKRGGLVLSHENKLLVTNAEEFASQHNLNPKAMMEYAFTIDSTDLKGSFANIDAASSSLLKDIAYSSEFMNTIVTVYQNETNYHTFLLAGYEPDPKTAPFTTNSVMLGLNLFQIASLTDQLKEQLGGNRFVIVVTDPSPTSSNCYAPWSMEKDELTQQNYSYEETNTPWLGNLGIKETYFRTIGSTANFAFPETSFPWVLGSKK